VLSIFTILNRSSYTSQETISPEFSYFSRILHLASYFSNNFAGKISAALMALHVLGLFIVEYQPVKNGVV